MLSARIGNARWRLRIKDETARPSPLNLARRVSGEKKKNNGKEKDDCAGIEIVDVGVRDAVKFS